MKGREKGIQAIIETCRELNISKEDTFTKIKDKFDMSEEDTETFMNKYWKHDNE